MTMRIIGADARTVRTWDGILLFWAVFWLVVGAWAGYQIWQLTGLSASTVESGRALQSAGKALQTMSDIPLIGQQTGDLGNQVISTADGIIESGHQAERSIRGLSLLIGLAIGLGPTGPVLLFYLPARIARARETRTIRRALGEGSGDAGLQAYLAGRALSNLRYGDLRRISSDPRGDLAAGHHERLARAELARLGLAPPP